MSPESSRSCDQDRQRDAVVDAWLRHELRNKYGAILGDDIPDELLDLINASTVPTHIPEQDS
ncbi:hypothetical protein AA101099_0630 [Neoasaia chiangmaiensis NBRC 101099]|nr:hypothetical protein AA101099_0630 [Neoasaia chiangmaiensis NBRC 101099]GEN16473.1 hypothetical protein NCH01_29040 [Neoasaia chiangmaiensis]